MIFDFRQQPNASLSALPTRHSDRAIEQDDWRSIKAIKLSVQCGNRLPISFGIAGRHNMQGRDFGLQMILRQLFASRRMAKMPQSSRDQPAIP